MDFLWHKVSDKEKEQIKKDAKIIMDSFSKKLARVKNVPESVIERENFERDELDGEKVEIDTLKGTSRKIMFENAPNKNDNFIIGEKGGW